MSNFSFPLASFSDYYSNTSASDGQTFTLVFCFEYGDFETGPGRWDVTEYWPVRWVMAVVYTVLFGVGLLSNISVVIIQRKSKKSNDHLLMNLMLSNILLCLGNIPFTPMIMIEKQWHYGQFLCRSLALSCSIAVNVSSYSLAAMCYNKYRHITDVTLGPMSVKRTWMWMGGFWAVAVVLSLPLYVRQALVVGGDTSGWLLCGEWCVEIWPNKTHRYIYSAVAFVLQFILPLIVIIISYWRIFAKINRDMLTAGHEFGTEMSNRHLLTNANKKRKALRLSIGIVTSFSIGWMPLMIRNMIDDFEMWPDSVYYYYIAICLFTHVFGMSLVVIMPALVYWLTKRSMESTKRTKGAISTRKQRTSLVVPPKLSHSHCRDESKSKDVKEVQCLLEHDEDKNAECNDMIGLDDANQTLTIHVANTRLTFRHSVSCTQL